MTVVLPAYAEGTDVVVALLTDGNRPTIVDVLARGGPSCSVLAAAGGLAVRGGGGGGGGGARSPIRQLKR